MKCSIGETTHTKSLQLFPSNQSADSLGQCSVLEQQWQTVQSGGDRDMYDHDYVTLGDMGAVSQRSKKFISIGSYPMICVMKT